MGAFAEFMRAVADVLRAVAWPVTVFLLAILGYRHGVLEQLLKRLEPLLERLREIRAGAVRAKFFDEAHLKSPKEEMRAAEAAPLPSTPASNAPPEVIDARALVLRNSRGEVRALMYVTDEDTPALTLFDPSGARRLAFNLIVDPSGEYVPILGLQDRNGNSRALLELDQDGRPHLSFIGGTGEGAARLGINEDGTAQLGLWDGRNKLRVMLRTVSDGDAGLALVDGAEKVRAALVVTQDGKSDLVRYSDES